MVGLLMISLSAVLYVSVAMHTASQALLDTKKPSDVILVLGARSYIDGAYNPCLKARVDHAVSLQKNRFAPVLLFSGGNDIEDNVNEAETMQKIASESGVPLGDMLLEKEATSTYENFVLAQKIMKKKNLNTVVIVTEPFHMARAKLIAEKLGMNYTVSPAIQSPCWTEGTYLTKYFLKEPLAILQYKLRGRL